MMDISNKYIEMCKEAWRYLEREIEVGDIIMADGDANPHRCMGICKLEKDFCGNVAKYQYIDGDLSRFIAEAHLKIYYGYIGHTFIVWTQAQLQWILKYIESDIRFPRGYDALLHHLKKFMDSLLDKDCETMEQLWLAFVMWEKYDKVWNDKDKKWRDISI